MKIAFCSDLHLEFGDLVLENSEGADVLVLAGDVLVARDITPRDSTKLPGFEFYKSDRFYTFIEDVCEKFPRVLYVMGNHEHYHGDFALSATKLRKCFQHLNNLTLLDRDFIQIDDVTFFGGTMWTDMNRSDSLTMSHMKSMMNDFVIVENSNNSVSYKTYLPDPDNPGKEITQFKTRPSRFSPEDATLEFRNFVQHLNLVIENREKVVVISHHAPSFRSIHKDYIHDIIMNGGYASDLELFMEDHPQIKLWFHGHMHKPFDYVVGETRVLCNPRGYAGYEDSGTFALKYVEV